MKVQIDMGDCCLVEMDEMTARKVRDRMCDIFGLPDMVPEIRRVDTGYLRVKAIWEAVQT